MALEQKKSELSITKPDSTFARYSYDQFKNQGQQSLATRIIRLYDIQV